ncbi:MAG: cysteine synthase [Deltaproteobacteria bacterium]|nr:cysteine synthase [Deltaproteobacteria bacterium]
MKKDGFTPDPVATLAAAMHEVGAIAARLVRADHEIPVRPCLDPATVVEEFELGLGEDGQPLDRVLHDLERILLASPATAGPRFWNQLFGGREAAATAADMLASVANHSMYTLKVAGPQVTLERIVLDRMMAIAGFVGGEATLAPGGSISNLGAMLIARNVASGDARDAGLHAIRGRVYTSGESHYSVRKAAMIAGIGRENCVDIAIDAQGRMRPDALDAALRADRAAGALPMMVNATAGTTVRGAFDPIDGIADVCATHGVWLHVDGAFGGSLLLSPRARHLLAGLERADSFTWDAHKLMGVPLLCSALMVRRRGLLTTHFGESASYLFQGDDEAVDPGRRSLQCGRRNDALKLWAAWRHHGDRGWAARVDRQLTLARSLAARVEGHPRLVLVEAPASLNVCIRVPGADATAVCAWLAREGEHLVGHATVRGETVVRVAVVDPAHTEADLAQLLHDLDRAGQALGGR